MGIIFFSICCVLPRQSVISNEFEIRLADIPYDYKDAQKFPEYFCKEWNKRNSEKILFHKTFSEPPDSVIRFFKKVFPKYDTYVADFLVGGEGLERLWYVYDESKGPILYFHRGRGYSSILSMANSEVGNVDRPSIIVRVIADFIAFCHYIEVLNIFNSDGWFQCWLGNSKGVPLELLIIKYDPTEGFSKMELMLVD